MTDNLTDYHEQDSRGESSLLEELQEIPDDRLSLIDELINASVSQIDRQIEENVVNFKFHQKTIFSHH